MARYDGAEREYIVLGITGVADCLTMHGLAALHTALNMYFVFLMGIGIYLGDGVEK